MKQKSISKNATIELLRFVAAITVITYHLFSINIPMDGLFEYTFVIVEFFFLLSGFFMMAHIKKSECLSTPGYLLGKTRSFYPIFIVAFALQFLLFVLTTPLTSAAEVGGALFHFKWEAMLLQTAGFIQDPQFNIDYLLGQTWYLSAMLLSLLVLFPLAKKLKNSFATTLSPIVAVLLYAYITTTSGTVNVGTEFYGLISSAIVRAIAGICLGAATHAAYCHFKEKGIRNIKPAITLEVFAYIMLLLMFLIGFFENRFVSDEDGLIFVLMFAFLIVFAVLDKTPISHYLNTHGTKATCYLGSLSLYLYLLHWPIMTALRYFQLPTTATIIVYYIACFLLSIALRWYNDRRKNNVGIIVFVLLIFAFSLTLPYWAV